MIIQFIVKGTGDFPTLEDTGCVFASVGSCEIAKHEEGERMVRLLTEGEIPEDHFADWGWLVVARMSV